MVKIQLPFIEETYISAKTPFEKSQIVILGCPYDGSSSFRPGARFGPHAIRKASWGIETYSPYFGRDLEDLSIHDMGDLELPLGEKTVSLDLIKRALREILSKKKFPILLGGDHLIALPIVEEMLRFYPSLRVLHIDAHTDLREDYLGEILSHSSVMRKVFDILGKGRLFQLGIRSGTKEEFSFTRRTKSLISLDKNSLRSMVRTLKNKPVYLSFDLDVIDPSLLPGVGTPEPGGLTFKDFISFLKEIQSLKIVGFDIVELTPDYDPTQISSITASIILREMILAFCYESD